MDRLAQAEEVSLADLRDLGLAAIRRFTRSVKVTEGAIALTRILYGAYSTAIERVIEAMPPLAAV